MKLENLSGKVVVLTGAGSGIGRALGRECAKRGAELYVCDRDAEALADACGEFEGLGAKVKSWVVDVASSEQYARFADGVHSHIEAADVLINNAGVAVLAKFDDLTLEDWHWVMATNFWGVVHGLHFFAPKMLLRGAAGQIINMSSGQGFAGVRFGAPYAASKFGVAGVSEVVRQELANSPIGVTAVFPGMVKTNIINTVLRRGMFEGDALFNRFASFFRAKGEDPNDVAKTILRGASRNRPMVLTTSSWPVYVLKRLWPGLVPKIFARLEQGVFGRLEG